MVELHDLGRVLLPTVHARLVLQVPNELPVLLASLVRRSITGSAVLGVLPSLGHVGAHIQFLFFVPVWVLCPISSLALGNLFPVSPSVSLFLCQCAALG